MNRRKFLAFLGIGTAAAITGTKLLGQPKNPVTETTNWHGNQLTTVKRTFDSEGREKTWYLRPGDDFKADNERQKEMYLKREQELLFGKFGK